jgi:hypothetical protein
MEMKSIAGDDIVKTSPLGCRGQKFFTRSDWVVHCSNRHKRTGQTIILTDLKMTLEDMVILISCSQGATEPGEVSIDTLPWRW